MYRPNVFIWEHSNFFFYDQLKINVLELLGQDGTSTQDKIENNDYPPKNLLKIFFFFPTIWHVHLLALA